MLMTPYFPAVSWLSSTSNLTILTLSDISSSSSSKTGAIILHGPHHGAQKSAKTNPSAVSSEKFLSVTFEIAIFYMPPINHSLSLIISPLLFPSEYFAYVSFRSEEHTSELQSRFDLVCRLLLEKTN